MWTLKDLILSGSFSLPRIIETPVPFPLCGVRGETRADRRKPTPLCFPPEANGVSSNTNPLQLTVSVHIKLHFISQLSGPPYLTSQSHEDQLSPQSSVWNVALRSGPLELHPAVTLPWCASPGELRLFQADQSKEASTVLSHAHSGCSRRHDFKRQTYLLLRCDRWNLLQILIMYTLTRCSCCIWELLLFMVFILSPFLSSENHFMRRSTSYKVWQIKNKIHALNAESLTLLYCA